MLSFISTILCDGPTNVAAEAASAVASAGEAAGEAASEAAEEAAGFNWQPIVMIVVMIAIFYFLLIRPQKKQQKKIAEMRNSMRTGDTVVTSGGIYGKIVEVKDNAFILQIADGVRIKVDKSSVYSSMEDAAPNGK